MKNPSNTLDIILNFNKLILTSERDNHSWGLFTIGLFVLCHWYLFYKIIITSNIYIIFLYYIFLIIFYVNLYLHIWLTKFNLIINLWLKCQHGRRWKAGATFLHTASSRPIFGISCLFLSREPAQLFARWLLCLTCLSPRHFMILIKNCIKGKPGGG